MKIVGFAVAFAFILEYLVADNSEIFQIEKETDGTTDVLRVKDSSGKFVAVIDVHAEEDFQLIKPESENDYVCLILPAFTEETKVFKCYKRVPFPRDEYNADELAECGNREIFTLQPQFSEYCSNNVNEDPKGGIREKRSCTMKDNIVSTCVKQERYCKRYGWWIGSGSCKRYGYRCIEYQVDRVREEVCY